ncbi:MAG: hypothetical protein JSS26_05755 [Nitrospira sp.]|nr:hypothetical protein [Nitrospira sp.]
MTRFLLMINLLLSGCLLLNDVKPISIPDKLTGDRTMPVANRAVVILGLSVEGSGYNLYTHPFSIHTDEYSVEHQNITGNCWRYNYVEAKVTGIVGTRQYFAFNVKPGYYVARELFSASRKNLVFEVPAGRIVYLGDFIWTTEAKVEFKRESGAIKSYFGEDVVLAEIREAPHQVTGVLCTP